MSKIGEIEMKNLMEYKNFYASINYEEETSTFWGRIEFIEDIITFESDSLEGLKKEFKKVVEEHLEECKILNKDPYKPYKGSLNVRIEPLLHQKATLFSKQFNMSLNQFVEKAIREQIEKCEKLKQ